MNRESLLAQTSLFAVTRFYHAGEEPHRDPAAEQAGSFAVNLVEGGRFEIITDEALQVFSKGMAFLTWPGLRYRTRHAGDFPDDSCFSVQYGPELAADSLRPGRFALTPTNRLAYVHNRLIRRTAVAADPLALETDGADLLAAAAEAAQGRPSKLYRASQLSWYARRIDAAREFLDERMAEPHTLASLGRVSGMSPYHFAHIFRELTGTAPHRYLTHLRLKRARSLLREGRSVTCACFDVGFSNLSHFSRQFRRAYGQSPSRAR